jgi:hypothetical protein
MQTLAGKWVGHIDFHDERRDIAPEFGAVGGTLNGLRLASFYFDGARLRFDFTDAVGRLHVEARLDADGTLRGAAQRDGQSCCAAGRLILTRITQSNPAPRCDMIGIPHGRPI